MDALFIDPDVRGCGVGRMLVKRMLNKGLESLAEGEKPLLHSDQGWHYRIKSYQSALALSLIHIYCADSVETSVQTSGRTWL